MFVVVLDPCRDSRYHPLTVNVTEYLCGLAESIARSVPDAEVHTRLGACGDRVLRGKDLDRVLRADLLGGDLP